VRRAATGPRTTAGASPLPSSVAYELRLLGLLSIDLHTLQSADGRITPHLTDDGALGLQITLHDPDYDISGLEGLLALLRLGHINYTIWDSNGIGRAFDAATNDEQTFTVLADGAPFLTAADLDPLERAGSAEALLQAVRQMLRRTTPPFVEALKPEHVDLIIREDDPALDEPEDPIDSEDERS
jgi:hypothetical protein